MEALNLNTVTQMRHREHQIARHDGSLNPQAMQTWKYGMSGRTTPREARMSGNHPPTETHFRTTLRPGFREKVRPRARSAGPRSQRDIINEGGDFSRAADKAAANDAEWRCGSYRYANAHFYDTLRSWDGKTDISTRTPKDWRVSAADTMGLGGTSGGLNGHTSADLSLNDAEGWRRSSSTWVEKQFRNNMRAYPGQDVGFDEHGIPKKQGKIVGDVSSGQGDTIYRKKKQSDSLSTYRAHQHFSGSLRSSESVDADEYARRRRRNLNLPQYKDLPAEVISKSKRLFAQIDADGSGTVDAQELRKFLEGMGHKVEGGNKAIQELMKQADEGATDCKLAIKEFARLYHGLKL
uniref:EF-hand domain-containing protein n=1 Tax=Haptolina brevifila TaxID=156173 RepID=A0A7S2MYF3_9EUKA|eukprot:CAMPEP_0174717546 /NCGR_PEP_ID=MMETSP1094-20130205/26534_1 /TAXON_ID=156173 /ORGANISM="Chrysochromulina brevifilum, Strain UTEX LB 985" /LENGTH=350 /DNA_ID=CAMNT_0015917493 /DNA_START=51 /DNA_END=1103 /DNA_ORIENTATION=-